MPPGSVLAKFRDHTASYHAVNQIAGLVFHNPNGFAVAKNFAQRGNELYRRRVDIWEVANKSDPQCLTLRVSSAVADSRRQ